MFRGILYAISACLIWGTIFVIPLYLEEFNAIEIAVGRYLFYGLYSVFLWMKAAPNEKISKEVWKKTLIYSLVIGVLCYPGIVLGIQWASPAISALIFGLSPIAIAFYGNWRERAYSFKSLLFPSLLIFAGLIFINAPAIQGQPLSSNYLLGVFASFIALFGWCWYVVANSRFLKQNPAISSSLWSTLTGIGTLVWTGIFVAGALIFFSEQVSVEKYTTLSPSLLKFITGSLILGIFCSWVAFFLWNRATACLPVPFVGLLSTFETTFGLLFIYLYQQRMPPWTEGVGATLFLISIVYFIKKFSSGEAQLQQD